MMLQIGDEFNPIDKTVHLPPELMFLIRLIIISVSFKVVLVLLFRIDWFKIKWTRFLKKYKKEHESEKTN